MMYVMRQGAEHTKHGVVATKPILLNACMWVLQVRTVAGREQLEKSMNAVEPEHDTRAVSAAVSELLPSEVRRMVCLFPLCPLLTHVMMAFITTSSLRQITTCWLCRRNRSASSMQQCRGVVA